MCVCVYMCAWVYYCVCSFLFFTFTHSLTHTHIYTHTHTHTHITQTADIFPEAATAAAKRFTTADGQKIYHLPDAAKVCVYQAFITWWENEKGKAEHHGLSIFQDHPKPSESYFYRVWRKDAALRSCVKLARKKGTHKMCGRCATYM